MKELKSDARATLESSIITALWKTSPMTHITIDKCNEVIPQIIDELFSEQTRWAVEKYLVEVKK